MVREQRLESFYTRLCESAMALSESPLPIFPSTSDVDSLCALKIILHVLESDSVRHACYPVSSFGEIHKYAGPNLCSSSKTAISILLINWGSQRDLKSVLNLGPKARIFVIDSHRPIHLPNLSDGNDNVIVLYTPDDEQQADLDYDFDVTALSNACNLEIDDADLDSEEENESDSEEEENGDGLRKRRRGSLEIGEDPEI